MPDVIKLMTENMCFFPAFCAYPWMGIVSHDSAVSINITIIFLGKSDIVDQCIKVGFQGGIGKGLKRITSSFNNFKNIRIIKRIIRLKFPFFKSAGNFKIPDTSGFFRLLKSNWNCYFMISFNFWCPEIIGYFYTCEWEIGRASCRERV